MKGLGVKEGGRVRPSVLCRDMFCSGKTKITCVSLRFSGYHKPGRTLVQTGEDAPLFCSSLVRRQAVRVRGCNPLAVEGVYYCGGAPELTEKGET